MDYQVTPEGELIQQKLGANYSDIRMIKSLAREGHSPEVISEALRIDLACVKSFAEDPTANVKGTVISQKTPDMPPIPAPKAKAKSKKPKGD